MERLVTAEEKRRLRAYFGQFSKYSRIALFVFTPLWLTAIALLVQAILTMPTAEEWTTAKFLFTSISLLEFSIALTLIVGQALWYNRSERWEIGRVKQELGTLTRNNAGVLLLDRRQLWLASTIPVPVEPHLNRRVTVDLAMVLHSERDKEKEEIFIVLAIAPAGREKSEKVRRGRVSRR